jgi:serine/threonine protein kinase
MTQPTSLQNGRYAIRYEVSRDPCGVLLLAVDNKMAGREVMIRQLSDSLSAGQMQRIAQLNHSTLPSVYDLFDEVGNRYLVTEHPVGQTLADIALGPRLKEGTVIAWMRQIAQGLSYLHTQRPPIAHGDLRPDNIILQDGRRIKMIGGTPAGCGAMPPSRYAAPEQISGGEPSPSADVYALGAILHHLLTNIDPNTQPLMAFAPPDVRRPDLSPSTSAAIVRALSQQPAQRFPSVDAFLQALTAGGSDQSSGDMPVIGFTPSVPQGPVDGPTVHYSPSPSTPIPVPPNSGYTAEPAYSDPYQSGSTGYNQGYGPPPSRVPERPATGGGRTGMVILGVLLVLALLGGGGWLAFSFLRDDDPSRSTTVALNNLPTTTREEGRLLSTADQTATAQAGIVPTTIATLDFSQATADALQTSTAATAAAVTNDLEAIYQRGVAYEETNQFALAASDYDEVLRRDPTYKDTQARRDRVQIYLDATATAESQAAADAAASATAAAQPSITPTPEPPTATPVGELLGDEFDAGELDPARWASQPNGGTITLAEGALQLAAPSNTCFPVVQALTTTTTFPTGNFDLAVVFRYASVTPLGTGFMLSTDLPANCGSSDRAGAAWGGVWQDAQRGLIVEFHRDAASDVPLKDIRYEYSPGTIDTNQHTFLIQRRGTTDTYLMDDATLFSEPAGPAPRVLWFGNPGQSPAPAEWTALNILAVRLRQQP